MSRWDFFVGGRIGFHFGWVRARGVGKFNLKKIFLLLSVRAQEILGSDANTLIFVCRISIIITVMVSAVIQPAERTLRSRAKKRQRVEDYVFVWNWNERSGHLHQVCPSRRSRFERRPAVHQRPAPSRQRRLSAGTIQHGSDGRIEARRSSGRSQTGPHNRKMHALKDREVTLEGQSQDDTVNGTGPTDGRDRPLPEQPPPQSPLSETSMRSDGGRPSDSDAPTYTSQ